MKNLSPRPTPHLYIRQLGLNLPGIGGPGGSWTAANTALYFTGKHKLPSAGLGRAGHLQVEISLEGHEHIQSALGPSTVPLRTAIMLTHVPFAPALHLSILSRWPSATSTSKQEQDKQ